MADDQTLSPSAQNANSNNLPAGGAGGDGPTAPTGPGALFMNPINLEKERRRSHLDHSMSVIIRRALPDAETYTLALTCGGTESGFTTLTVQ